MTFLYMIISGISLGIFMLAKYVLILINDLSEYNFLGESLDEFTSKIYVIIGVLMLFKLVISAVQYIVNPEVFTDNKKGLGAVLKKSIIAVALLAIIPSVFDFAMEAQHEIVEQIPRIIFGGNNVDMGNTGDILAKTVMFSFLDIKPGKTKKVELNKVEDFYAVAMDGCSYNFLTGDFWLGDPCVYNIWFLLLVPVAGVFLLFMLISMVFDIATRTIKLGIVKLLAPIPVTSYIVDEQKLTKWASTAGQIYADLFVRLGIIYLIVYIVQKLVNEMFKTTGFENRFRDPSGMEIALVKILIIFALLMFAKNAPKFISDLLGLKGSGEGFADMFKRAGGLFGTATSAPGRFSAARRNEMNNIAKKYGNGKAYDEMSRRERRTMLERARADGKNPRTHTLATALRSAGAGLSHGAYESMAHNKGYSEARSASRSAADRSYAISKAIDAKGITRSDYRHAARDQRRGIESSYSMGSHEMELSREISDSSKKALDWSHENLIKKNGTAQLTTEYISKLYSLSDGGKAADSLIKAMNFQIKDSAGTTWLNIKMDDLNKDAGGTLTIGDVQKALMDIVNDTSGKFDSIAKRQAETQLDVFNGEVDKFIVGEASKVSADPDHKDASSGVKYNPLFADLLQDANDKFAANKNSQFAKEILQKGIEKGIIDETTGEPFPGLEGLWINMLKSSGLEASTSAKKGMGEREMAAKSAEDIAKQFNNKK